MGTDMGHEPIAPGSPLARMLDDYPVPPLSAGFADRVLAAAQTRAAPLPAKRSARRGWGWRMGRGLAIGVAGFGVLASAAAATGLLDRYNLPVPSAAQVWASVTGSAAPAAAPTKAAAPEPAPALAITDSPPAPVVIEGPVDTPEELAEAFRRIDAVRQGRSEARMAMTEQKIDAAIARRRAEGLPLPTPEEEARLRQRIAKAQAQRDERAAERVALRREEMARKVENGEALTREDILRPLREDQRALERQDRLRRLRQMTPAQRRAALRRLPPEERAAMIELWRARRGAAQPGQAPAAPTIAPLVDTAPVPEPVPSDAMAGPDPVAE
jgi:hypothetical protein